MDRLISLEPSKTIAIRVEPGRKCSGELTLRNVMHTMPVAFQLHPVNKASYVIRPQSGIIGALSTLTVEIVYLLPESSTLPALFPRSNDTFILHSIVVPGAVVKNPCESIPSEWFTARRKQAFYDSGIRVMFVGSVILAQLAENGSVEEIRDVLERSNPEWRAADSVLHSAIRQRRVDLVKILLEFIRDVNDVQSGNSECALELAVAVGEVLIIELLLARKCSIRGSLHLAVRGGDIRIIELLLLNGANPNSLNGDGQTALHIAVEERKVDCAKTLLASNAKVNLVNTSGDTALHQASAIGDEDMVMLLLQNGANKEIRNQVGKTAYDVAAEHSRSTLYDVLKLGDSLSAASRKGEARTIKRLVENGASINGVDQHGWTALHRAAFKGEVNAVRAILSISRNINIDAKDEEGYTALHCATESGQIEVIRVLLKRGADVGVKTKKGVTSLEIANLLCYSAISRMLVEGSNGREISIKKKHTRSRSQRRSFNKTLALTVT